jgi:hypothetical protein
MNAAVVHYIRGDAKCRSQVRGKVCGHRLSAHVDGRCPEIPKEYCSQRGEKRISLSMNLREIDAAAHILNGILAGKPLAELRSHVGFRDLARVVLSTQQRAKVQKMGAR